MAFPTPVGFVGGLTPKLATIGAVLLGLANLPTVPDTGFVTCHPGGGLMPTVMIVAWVTL